MDFDEELTEENFKGIVNRFYTKYNLTLEEAHDCAVDMLKKNNFKWTHFCNEMLSYSYVDIVRQKLGRTHDGQPGPKAKMNAAIFHYTGEDGEEISRYAHAFVTKGELEYTVKKAVDILRKYGCRRFVATGNEIQLKGNKVMMFHRRRISIRRILFKSLLGWSQIEIAEYCGVSSSRISQIIKAECKRIGKALNSKKSAERNSEIF